MIRIELSPGRIERISFESKSEVERDFDQVAYRLIQPLVMRIDTRLRRAVCEVLADNPRRRRASWE